MPATPAPAIVSVSYQPPAARALSAAQRTGLAALISAILLGVLPLGITFLQGGDFSRGSVQALVTAAGVVVLTVILAYVQKLSEAKADDAKAAPAIIPGETGMIGEAVALPVLPLIDGGLLVQLVERTLRDSLASAAPEPPPATISHRIVTAPPDAALDAPVKRSHHAKPPAVAPIDVAADH